MYSLRARYYARENGRFVSRDQHQGNYEDELNRYVYVAGNLVMFSDPSGYGITESSLIKKSIATISNSIRFVTQTSFRDGALAGLGGYFVGVLYSFITDGDPIVVISSSFGNMLQSMLIGGILGVFNSNIINDIRIDPRYLDGFRVSITLQSIFNHGWPQLTGAFSMLGAGMYAGMGQSMFNEIIGRGEFASFEELMAGASAGFFNVIASLDIHLDNSRKGRLMSIFISTTGNTLGYLLSKGIEAISKRE